MQSTKRTGSFFALLQSAAMLAISVLGFGHVASAQQTCTAHSIDAVGKCAALRSNRSVQRIVRENLSGVSVAPVPPPFDANLLASQIAGDFSIGHASMVRGGAPGEWMLSITPATLNEDGVIAGEQSNSDSVRIALLHLRPAPQTRNDETQTVIELKGTFDASDFLAHNESDAGPTCLNPAPDIDTGSYALTGRYRWLMLSPGHPVLEAGIVSNVGYAGGGGQFDSSLLLSVQDGHFTPIACYSVSNYQMFGGEWNKDGTRQHPEAYSAWRMHVKVHPGSSWPDLELQPLTRSTPRAKLRWDTAKGHYVQDAPTTEDAPAQNSSANRIHGNTSRAHGSSKP